MTRHQLGQLLKRHGLVRLENSEPVRRAFEVYHKRTQGLAEVAWLSNNWSPEQIGKAFEQFGFDCYTQGLVDAASMALQHPQVFQATLAAITNTEGDQQHV